MTAGDADADATHMRAALAEAAAAGLAGEVPVGCVVVHGPSGRVVGRGQNRRERDADPTAHAEVVALRDAGRATGSWRLVDCTLYVTLEPCPMCAGAAVNARLGRVVYGCADPKAGAIDTLFQLCRDPRLNHRPAADGGVLADECAALLVAFFRGRRGKSK